MKNILITGATSGIGLATAKELAKQGHNVFPVGRYPQKVRETVAILNTINPKTKGEGFVADLSSQAEIKKLAAEVKSKISRLDVLINNAGAYFSSQNFSADNIELTWATNHLGYFLLTHELLELLKTSSPARIVNVASHSHYKGKINFEDISLTKNWAGYKAYEQSKLGNVLFTIELAKKLEGTGISVNSLHPGVVSTEIAQKNAAWYVKLFWSLTRATLAISVEKGAETSVFLATSPEVEGVSGKYFDKKKHKWHSHFSQTPGLAEKCWQLSNKMTGLNW
jgi:NAD(P)-dependent dehydrogenase (short-subunit alcohol dehydrogenase family)